MVYKPLMEILEKGGISSSVDEIYETIETISRRQGVSYSSDIMYNFREQKIEELLFDLRQIDRLGCEYIDAYSFNILPNAYYHKLIETGYFSEKPNDKNKIEMCSMVNTWMKENGYNQVMVNTFSKVSDKSATMLDLYLNGSNVIGIGSFSRSFVEGAIGVKLTHNTIN